MCGYILGLQSAAYCFRVTVILTSGLISRKNRVQAFSLGELITIETHFLFQNKLFKKNFRNTIRVSNSMEPDQGRHSVGPDLGPDCLQMLSSDDKSDH